MSQGILLYGGIYSREVLHNNSASTDIHMANFRVAHLAYRQSDVDGGRFNLRFWIVGDELNSLDTIDLIELLQ